MINFDFIRVNIYEFGFKIKKIINYNCCIIKISFFLFNFNFYKIYKLQFLLKK
jgi:hypothetical protein